MRMNSQGHQINLQQKIQPKFHLKYSACFFRGGGEGEASRKSLQPPRGTAWFCFSLVCSISFQQRIKSLLKVQHEFHQSHFLYLYLNGKE
jgi:hypothetical protein